jgi:hypothetical protein
MKRPTAQSLHDDDCGASCDVPIEQSPQPVAPVAFAN